MEELTDSRRERTRAFAEWISAHWLKLVALAVVATVAAVAGTISYSHIDALTRRLGGSPMAGHLMPFAVDGQIVMGSIVLLTARGRQQHWGWLGIVPGLAESLFANYQAGIGHGHLGAAWYTVPAEAFAVASFLFERWAKSLVSDLGQPGPADTPTGEPDEPATGEEQPHPCTHYVGSTAEESALQAWAHARDCLGAPLSQRKLSDQYGISRRRVAQLVGEPGEEADIDAA